MSSVKDIEVEFRHMRIGYPALYEIHDHFDRLRQSRRAAMEDPRGTKTEASCISIFWKSHAGKTTVLNWYVETRFPGPRSEEWPDMIDPELRVVVVTLDSGTNYLGFVKQLLKAFGCPFYLKGSRPWELLDRLHLYIAGKKTELIIFDETNNLRMRKATDDDATNMHNALRGIAKKQGCPIVLVGTEEAKERVFSDTQISSISLQLPLEPLKVNDPLFTEYCATLGLKLVEHGLFPKRSNFVQGYCIPCLHAASGGLRGRVSRLVERAADYARIEGADRVEIRHLEKATDSYAIPNGFVDINPFRVARISEEEARRRLLVDRAVSKAAAAKPPRKRANSDRDETSGC
ncbi:TniB family NTP-binding protein [Rhizobium sp. R693]|uniref:TniB family NTP-binding protein n=1 Tax=Rhizobium sp. R693 TaxID=1764276 RepID=UPI000B537ED4|nr:TniB family NTP-binding protein [Rhizobium sp. R693]OWV86812.1 hypothetical protein ATY79_08320 [Rhizobium sp. R693]